MLVERRTSLLALVCIALASSACSSSEPAESQTVDSGEDTAIVEDTSVDSSAEDVAVDSTAPDTNVAADTSDTAEAPSACPGIALTLTGTGSAPRVASVTGNTSIGASPTLASSCGGGGSPETVY